MASPQGPFIFKYVHFGYWEESRLLQKQDLGEMTVGNEELEMKVREQQLQSQFTLDGNLVRVACVFDFLMECGNRRPS